MNRLIKAFLLIFAVSPVLVIPFMDRNYSFVSGWFLFFTVPVALGGFIILALTSWALKRTETSSDNDLYVYPENLEDGSGRDGKDVR